MKQVVASKNGNLEVIEVPAPPLHPGFVLARTRYSLVSAGTEGAQIREGRAGLVTKIREHPEQVSQVFSKLRKEGFRAVSAQVKDKLEQWRPLGYSLSGEVIEVGEGVTGVVPGDRVACAGSGYAVHAEIVSVPLNLLVRIPEGIELRHAAFATLGAIALHGVRRADPTLGETALVMGLGLVGQLTAQLLKASGVRVVVVDPDTARRDLAVRLGADLALAPEQDAPAEISAWTRGLGVDMALIAAATPSAEPVQEAARLLRDRGRIVVVGDVGLELERGPFFSKEIGFTLSRSYGPGRYDPLYEEAGVDYPVGYVRWTEGRNLALVLELMRAGKLRVEELITDEIPLENAREAYERILAGKGSLGTLLRFDGEEPVRRTLGLRNPSSLSGKIGVLLAGPGAFARAVHLPNLSRVEPLRLVGVVAATGANARQVADKYRADFASTDYEEALGRDEVEAVLIATRHHLHVPQAASAVRAGKHVFLEKPLALDLAGLRELARALAGHPVTLSVGFNRRFAPLAQHLARLLAGRQGPLHGVFRVNAGRLPRAHWINHPEEGGGRILGEGCHFFDFFDYLTGGIPVHVESSPVRSPDPEVGPEDNLTATVTYDDGSVMTLLYTTQGPKGYAKEQLEVFAPGFAATLIDFRELRWTGGRGGRRTLSHEDKGQAEELRAWAAHLRGERVGMADFPAALRSTCVTIAALQAARSGERVAVQSLIEEAQGV